MNCQSLYLQRIQKKAAMEMASGNIRHACTEPKKKQKPKKSTWIILAVPKEKRNEYTKAINLPCGGSKKS